MRTTTRHRQPELLAWRVEVDIDWPFNTIWCALNEAPEQSSVTIRVANHWPEDTDIAPEVLADLARRRHLRLKFVGTPRVVGAWWHGVRRALEVQRRRRLEVVR